MPWDRVWDCITKSHFVIRSRAFVIQFRGISTGETLLGSMFSTIYAIGTLEKVDFAWDSGTPGHIPRVFNALDVSHRVSNEK